MSLTRESFLSYQSTPEDYEVKSLGDTIKLKKLSGENRQEIIKSINETKESKEKLFELQARLILMAAVDDNGSQLFKPEDITVLMAKDADIIDDISTHILKVNGLSKDAVAQAEKN